MIKNHSLPYNFSFASGRIVPYINIYIYIYIERERESYYNAEIKTVKLATLVEGDSKALFSIATTLRFREGRYSIPLIALLYPWSLAYNDKC